MLYKDEDDVLASVVETLDGISDETIARVLTKYGKKRGMPVIAYSSADIREVLLELAGDHPGVMLSKFPKIVDDVVHSEKWQETADHAQGVIEQDLYEAVMDSMRRLS